jgi:hypothetical protein
VALIASVGVQLGANLAYDDARTDFSDAVTLTTQRRSALEAENEALRVVSESGTAITAADSGLLMPADERTSLDAAIIEVASTIEDAESAATASVPGAGEKQFWFWELFSEADRLRDDAGTLADQFDDVEEHRTKVAEAGTVVEEAAVAAVQGAAMAASEFEAAHVNARNPEILTLRSAAAAGESIVALDADTVARYAALEAAATAMIESENAELAEKEGPLRGARVDIEAFARGLAPGVLLDFDWSPTVPGYNGPSYGGWTTWWYGEPGYATIALSDYIAESWPADWAQALVAHEVGHAISVKCETAYDSSNQDTIEDWATAWAISMGFTHRGNGTDVYGPPPQSLIDAAASCR